MKNLYKVKNRRLSMYLYSLGFERQSVVGKDGKEFWLFEINTQFQEALDFYFRIRKLNRK